MLDECIPRRFKSALIGHECLTAPEAGLSGKTNVELLRLAEPDFDALVTLDQGLEYQQNMTGRKIAVIIIFTRSNRIADVQQHASACLEGQRSIKPGQLMKIGFVPQA